MIKLIDSPPSLNQTVVNRMIQTPLPSPLSVRILRSLEELETIRDIWTRWQTHPNCDFDFYRGVVETTPTIRRPHVVVVYRDGVASSMLVGRLERHSVNLSIGYKRIMEFPAECLTFLHGGYIGERTIGSALALTTSIDRSLTEGDADIAYFNHLSTDGPLYTEMCRPNAMYSSVCLGASYSHRGVLLSASGEEFVRKLTTGERNNQRRRTKRIAADFGDKARIAKFDSAATLDQMIKDIDCIASKTYQRTLGVGFEDTPVTRKRLEIEAEHGWLRAYILYLDDRPCAFWMGNVYARTFYSGFTGYDPQFAKYAPGMFLLLKVMEQLCEENRANTIHKADFGLGDAEWKTIVGDQAWEEAAVYLFAQKPKGRMLGFLHRGSDRLNRAGKRLLAKRQLIGKVKSSWRRRLSKTGN